MRFIICSPDIGPPWDWTAISSGIGGSETYHIEMALRLAARGHEVISYNHTKWRHIRGGAGSIPYAGVDWRDSNNMERAEPGIWVIQRNPQAIDSFQPTDDQVFWHVYHDLQYVGETPELVERYDRLLALSEFHRHYLAVSLGYRNVTLSSSGIAADRMAAIPEQDRNLKRIIYSSSPERGLETLLKCFQRAREFVDDLELHCFYGWDSRYESGNLILKRTKERIEKLLEQPGVTWHGRVGHDDLGIEFLKSGMWVYPTEFYETACITAMEAQALGAVPIYSPLWALRDNVFAGCPIEGRCDTDRLIQARFTYAMVRLATKQMLQERIRESMMPIARQRFSWDRAVEQFEAMAEQDLGTPIKRRSSAISKTNEGTVVGTNPVSAAPSPGTADWPIVEALPSDHFVRRSNGDVFGGWFSDANKRNLDRLIRKHQIKTVVEIGSFLGYSAAWFARRVDQVVCIDKFQEVQAAMSNNNLVGILPKLGIPRDFYEMFLRNMVAEGVRDKIIPIRGWSHDKAVLEAVRFADLVYVDGDHDEDPFTRDVQLYLPKARKVICGDDYTEHFPGILKATAELLPGHQHEGSFWWWELLPEERLEVSEFGNGYELSDPQEGTIADAAD